MKSKNVSSVSVEELALARGKKSANLAQYSPKKPENLSFSSNSTSSTSQKKPSLNSKYIRVLISKYKPALEKFFEPYGIAGKEIVELKNDDGELIELVAMCDHFDAHFNDYEVFLDYNVNKRASSGDGVQMNSMLDYADDTGDTFSKDLANLLWIKVFGKKFSSTYPEDKKRYDSKKLERLTKSYSNQIPLDDRKILADLKRNEITGLYNHVTYGNANIQEYNERRGY